jgi:glucan 1,3-beta-glucosidase
LSASAWVSVAGTALVSGSLIGWTIANIPLESLTLGDWLRALAWAVLALIGPIAGAAAVATGTAVPSFARVLARSAERRPAVPAWVLGVLLMALTVLAVQAALGLVFDPRYRDFPFAPLTAAVAPFVFALRSWPRLRHLRASAETVAAATLALSVLYIAFNETLANRQALWFCAASLALAFTLLPERDTPG